jgi:hypothetical protein
MYKYIEVISYNVLNRSVHNGILKFQQCSFPIPSVTPYLQDLISCSMKLVCISITHILLRHHSNFVWAQEHLHLRLLCSYSFVFFLVQFPWTYFQPLVRFPFLLLLEFLFFSWTMKDYKCVPQVFMFAENMCIVLHRLTCICMPWQHLTLHIAVEKEDVVKVKIHIEWVVLSISSD